MATNGWQIELDEGADMYVASLRSAEHDEPQLVVRLPRRGIDDVALQAAGISLELQPDGAVAAYAQNSGLQTLANTQLSQLITAVVSTDSEEHSTVVQHLEAELVRALETVRRARGS